VAQFTAEGLVQFAPEWVAHFAAEPVVGFHRNTHQKWIFFKFSIIDFAFILRGKTEIIYIV